MEAPGTLTMPIRTWLAAMSKIACSDRFLLEIPYCRMGTVEAL